MKRKNPYIFVLVSLLVVSVIALLPTKVRPSVCQADFKLLKPGMTEGEVVELLHGLPRNDLRCDAIIWLPQADGRRISAFIAPGSPASPSFVREDLPKGGRPGLKAASTLDFFPWTAAKEGRQKLWVTKSGLLAIYFDRENRMVEKYYSDVDEMIPPSLGDWIASRPGMIRRSLGF